MIMLEAIANHYAGGWNPNVSSTVECALLSTTIIGYLFAFAGSVVGVIIVDKDSRLSVLKLDVMARGFCNVS